jgi:broad specificity phosphatase PhoE
MVVAHDGILRLIMMRLLGVGPERYWAFPFGLCCVTVIELRGGIARLRAHNLGAGLKDATGGRTRREVPSVPDQSSTGGRKNSRISPRRARR